jgi:hypothetical protein
VYGIPLNGTGKINGYENEKEQATGHLHRCKKKNPESADQDIRIDAFSSMAVQKRDRTGEIFQVRQAIAFLLVEDEGE